MTDQEIPLGALDAYLADPAASAAVRQWALVGGFALTVPDPPWRRRGGSGALLALIKITAEPLGQAPKQLLLKVCSAGSPAHEPIGYEEAWRKSADFARQHLQKMAFPPVLMNDGRVLLFLDVQVAIATSRTLGQIPGYLRPIGAAETVRLVLHEWNQLGTRRQEPMKIRDLLRLELRGVLDRGRSAYRWAQRSGVFVKDNYQASPSCNDLGFVKIMDVLGIGADLADTGINVLRGNSHGDLHLDNVVVPYTGAGTPDLRHIRLIDLSAFDSFAPLTRDVASLLLSSILSEVRSGISQPDSDSLVRLITANPHAVQRIGYSSAERAVSAIRTTAMTEFEPGAYPDFHLQYLSSLIAQAIVYTSYDNVGNAGKQWYFALSVEAAKELQALLSSRKRDLPKA